MKAPDLKVDNFNYNDITKPSKSMFFILETKLYFGNKNRWNNKTLRLKQNS